MNMRTRTPFGSAARALPGAGFGPGLAVLLLLAPAAAALAVETKAVNTHVAEVTARLKPAGSLPVGNRLALGIGLPLRNRPALDRLVRQLYDRRSPNFRRYLTPDQFADQFGPAEQDYQRVMEYARSNRLNIVRTFSNRAFVSVEGTVDDIQRTFGVRLHTYQHPTEPRQFYGPDVEPLVPADLPVLYLTGLDNYRLPRRNGHRVDAGQSHPPAQQGGSYPNGLYIGNDFRNAYLPGTSLNGSGQVVGVFELHARRHPGLRDRRRPALRPRGQRPELLDPGFGQ
jgi:xanthomonalisin